MVGTSAYLRKMVSNALYIAPADFPELMTLTGDVGGHVIIKKYKSRVREHRVPSLRPLADIDREEDLDSLP